MAIVPNKIKLLTQWFTPKSEARCHEMLRALKDNCDNPLIDQIILLNEPNEWAPYAHPKISQTPHGKRLTFGDAYQYICEHGKPDEAWCIVNLDIAFNASLKHLVFETRDDVYCLTRYEVRQDLALSQFPSPEDSASWELFSLDGVPVPGSQDTWIFLTPQRPLVPDFFTNLKAEDIPFGIFGCDNKIALILRLSGFRCQNPSKTLQTFHYHLTPDTEHDHGRRQIVLPSPYLLLPAVHLGERANNLLRIIASISIENTPYKSAPIVYTLELGDDVPIDQLQYRATFSLD